MLCNLESPTCTSSLRRGRPALPATAAPAVKEQLQTHHGQASPMPPKAGQTHRQPPPYLPARAALRTCPHLGSAVGRAWVAAAQAPAKGGVAGGVHVRTRVAALVLIRELGAPQAHTMATQKGRKASAKPAPARRPQVSRIDAPTSSSSSSPSTAVFGFPFSRSAAAGCTTPHNTALCAPPPPPPQPPSCPCPS